MDPHKPATLFVIYWELKHLMTNTLSAVAKRKSLFLDFPELTSDKIFAKSYWNSFPILKHDKTRILDWQNLQHTLADSICWSPSPGYRSTPHGQRPLHLKWIKTVKNTLGFSKFAWDWELSIVSSSCWYHISWKGKDQNLILLSFLEFWSIIIHSQEKIVNI